MPKIQRLKKRVGTALENLSKKRVENVRRIARKKHLSSLVTSSRFAFATSSRGSENILVPLSDAASAKRSALNARAEAKRVEVRHTTGWIGKAIRKIKGKN
ncbi:MAG: hypothetical protein Q7K42_02950 [Candidatus Diapherotrites archaeon]|nr:hypothetical protein [Candidatus Diapherotrites archaeon]